MEILGPPFIPPVYLIASLTAAKKSHKTKSKLPEERRKQSGQSAAEGEHCWEPSEHCWEPSCPHRPIPGHMNTESLQHFLCASMLADTAVLSRWFKNESVNLWAGSCVQESQRWPAPKDHLSLCGLFTALSDPSEPPAAVQRWMLCLTPGPTRDKAGQPAANQPFKTDVVPMCCQCLGTFILAKTIQTQTQPCHLAPSWINFFRFCLCASTEARSPLLLLLLIPETKGAANFFLVHF